MQVFYAPAVKKYVVTGAAIGFFLPLIARLFIRIISQQEINLHIQIRQLLGHPFGFYSYSALIALTVLYSVFYSFIGSVVGLLLFKLMKRRQGYTLLITKKVQQLSGILFLLFAFLFIKIDLMNTVQEKVHFPRIPPSVITFAQYIFMPSLDFSNKNFSPLQNVYPGKTTTTTTVDTAPATQTYPTTATQPQPTQIRMATAQELFTQLNVYRQRNGRTPLQWDTKLGNFAQTRANTFANIKCLDNHGGFDNYVKGGRGHCNLGFYGLGENSGYGEAGDAIYIIDTYYGTSTPHATNQLKTSWSHVGIGVNGTASDFVFGGDQIINPEHPC